MDFLFAPSTVSTHSHTHTHIETCTWTYTYKICIYFLYIYIWIYIRRTFVQPENCHTHRAFCIGDGKLYSTYTNMNVHLLLLLYQLYIPTSIHMENGGIFLIASCIVNVNYIYVRNTHICIYIVVLDAKEIYYWNMLYENKLIILW